MAEAQATPSSPLPGVKSRVTNPAVRRGPARATTHHGIQHSERVGWAACLRRDQCAEGAPDSAAWLFLSKQGLDAELKQQRIGASGPASLSSLPLVKEAVVRPTLVEPTYVSLRVRH